MTTFLERAIAAYARFCLRVFVLAGEALGVAVLIVGGALGDAVLYLASFMPGHNEEQRVTSLAIVCYATVALLSVATVGAVLILSLLEIRL